MSDARPRRRHQFHLSSLLVLLTLGALAIFGTQLWHEYVVLRYTYRAYSPEVAPESVAYNRELQLEMYHRFTPGLAVIAFGSLCGLWYAYAQRNHLGSTFIGLAFALPLLVFLSPLVTAYHPWFVAVYPFFIFLNITGAGGLITDLNDSKIYWLFLIPAATYSAWPIFIRRFGAAALLFAFTGLYGCFFARYFVVFMRNFD